MLGGTETGVDKFVFCQFPIAEGVQSLVAVAKVGDSGVFNFLNPCSDFQGDGIIQHMNDEEEKETYNYTYEFDTNGNPIYVNRNDWSHWGSLLWEL